jgi:hypothetical protein
MVGFLGRYDADYSEIKHQARLTMNTGSLQKLVRKDTQ